VIASLLAFVLASPPAPSASVTPPAAQEPGEPEKPSPVEALERLRGGGQEDEMVALFAEVERRLREIDRMLYDASAGRPAEGAEESGIDKLLRRSEEASKQVIEGIDRILQMAAERAQEQRQQQQQGGGGNQQQQSQQGDSPLDQQRSGQPGQRERTPEGTAPERQGGDLRDGHGATFDPVSERLPPVPRHDDEEPAVGGLADFVDGADVRMIDGRCGLCFADEAGFGLGIPGQLGRQEFQSDRALEARVFRLVDDAHAARAERIRDPVVGYRFTYHRAPVGPGVAAGVIRCGSPIAWTLPEIRYPDKARAAGVCPQLRCWAAVKHGIYGYAFSLFLIRDIMLM